MRDVEEHLTSAEVDLLARVFADELARGWIPTEHDLRDALGALRAAGVPVPEPAPVRR